MGVFAGAAVFVAVAVLWLLPAAGVPVLHQYQKDRITGFLSPSKDPAGATYNVNQSIIAVRHIDIEPKSWSWIKSASSPLSSPITGMKIPSPHAPPPESQLAGGAMSER